MTIDEPQTPATDAPISSDVALETPVGEGISAPASPSDSPSTDVSNPVPQALQEAPPVPEAPAPAMPGAEAPIAEALEPTPMTEAPKADAPVAEAPAAPMVEAPSVEAPVALTPAPEQPQVEVKASETPGVVSAQDDNLFDLYMSNPSAIEADLGGGEGRRHQKNDRVEATVTEVRGDRVFVDLGSKADAVILPAELSGPASDYNAGDKVSVIVVKPEGGDRGAEVSRKRAEIEEMWDGIVAAFENQTSIKAPVIERVKGGLTVDLGMPGQSVRGFVPATHVGNGKIRNLDRFQGSELELKIIELDRERKKVVLSNREAEAETRAKSKDEIFGRLKVDDVLEGTVRRLTDYGAFVDLGGVDGLLHISEMSWARIGHPKEIFKEGDTIKVKVLRLDKGTEKISLGHKQVLDDPWQTVRNVYSVGQTLTVNVTRLVASGGFIRLPEGAEAFMPVSEMSDQRVNDAAEVLQAGQEVEAKIIELKPEARRMVLSIRATKPGYVPRTESFRGGDADFRPRSPSNKVATGCRAFEADALPPAGRFGPHAVARRVTPEHSSQNTPKQRPGRTGGVSRRAALSNLICVAVSQPDASYAIGVRGELETYPS
ncbi:MAG: hypothetical protein C4320_10020, partial [Armatimonadota bacterium]